MKTKTFKTFTIASPFVMAFLIAPALAIEAPVDDAPPPPPAAGAEAQPPIAEAKPEAAVETAYLGVVSESVPEMLAVHLGLDPGIGIVVRAVMPDGPAAKAGLAENDIITSFAGENVGSSEDLTREVTGRKPGEALQIDVIQKGKRGALDVTLGIRPQAADMLGLKPLDNLQLDGIPQELADRVRGMIEGNLGELRLDMGGDPVEVVPQMEEAMRDLRQRMEKAMQGLDIPAAPGLGKLQIQQGATVRLMDEQGSIEVMSNEGGKEVTVRDKDNEITWTGPWDTDQDKAAAPDDIRQRVERLNFDERFQGNGLRLQMRGLNMDE